MSDPLFFMGRRSRFSKVSGERQTMTMTHNFTFGRHLTRDFVGSIGAKKLMHGSLGPCLISGSCRNRAWVSILCSWDQPEPVNRLLFLRLGPVAARCVEGRRE